MSIAPLAINLLSATYSEPRDIRVGINDPTNGYGASLVESLDRFTGRHTSVINIFVTLDDPLLKTKVSNTIKGNLFIPMITVEPKTFVSPDSFWAYIATIGPCYIRYAHEMNGNWYPAWANIDPAIYKANWKAFFAKRTPNAMRVWCVNSGDVPLGVNLAERYYPGDDQVDLIGIDGYNKAALTPDGIFKSMLTRVNTLSAKPKGICEWGTINSPTKGQFITDMFNFASDNDLKYIAAWNADRPEAYAVFGGSGGNTVFETHQAFIEYALAMVRLDSMYK